MTAPFDMSGTWNLTGAELAEREAVAWEQGLRHALAWLGLKHYGDVMAQDNPRHRKADK